MSKPNFAEMKIEVSDCRKYISQENNLQFTLILNHIFCKMTLLSLFRVRGVTSCIKSLIFRGHCLSTKYNYPIFFRVIIVINKFFLFYSLPWIYNLVVTDMTPVWLP